MSAQLLIAKLCTDPSLREEFQNSPDKVLEKYKIDPSKWDELKEINMFQINDFSAQIFYGRAKKIRSQVPYFRKIYSEDAFMDLLRELHSVFPSIPYNVSSIYSDLVNLLTLLEAKKSNPIMVDVLKYEIALYYTSMKDYILQMSENTHWDIDNKHIVLAEGVYLLDTAYPLNQLLQYAKNPHFTEIRPERTISIINRTSRDSIKFYRIDPFTFDFITSINDTISINEHIKQYVTKIGIPSYSEKLNQIVISLLNKGILVERKET